MFWVGLAILSAILFGLADFIVVLSERKSMDVISLYFTYSIIVGLVSLVFVLLFKKSVIEETIKYNRTQWSLVLGMCFLYFIAYILHFIALQKAPNPGYANALIMFHVIVLTLLSCYFLSKPINNLTIFGIAMMFVGGYFVTLYA